jgi:bifunctional non-homologous end joining protein LigD
MKTEINRCAYGQPAYVMKKHDATRLHYDLRLAWNGVLLSWAIPKGPSCCPGAIREAIEMYDHREAHMQFEGVHETGTIMLWDRGTWEPCSGYEDIGNCLYKGMLRFRLHGERLQGIWSLTRTNITRNERPILRLCKYPDSFAESYRNKCVLEEYPKSVSSGRTIDEIARDWIRPKNKHEGQMKLFEAA